jgi:SAM-dependent methyltransferase
MLGFPIEMIALVRCTHDGSELILEPGHCTTSHAPDAIESGSLRCRHCSEVFRIEGGTLNLFDHSRLDEESLHEQKRRNADGYTVDPLDTPLARAHHTMATAPTLEALPVNGASTILELGAGEGRYTLPLAARGARILAIDFSRELLGVLRTLLAPEARVGLVLADISTVKVARAEFDCALSTLTSNLPTRGHRESLYALVHHALHDAGRFVFCAHHHGIRQVLGRQEKSGRYRPGGIYRYNFTVRECVEEAAPFFGRVLAHPIQIHIPFARRMRLPIVRLSRMLERVPLLNRFGMLVLCVAEQPRKLVHRIAESKLYVMLVCSMTVFQAEFDICCEFL